LVVVRSSHRLTYRSSESMMLVRRMMERRLSMLALCLLAAVTAAVSTLEPVCRLIDDTDSPIRFIDVSAGSRVPWRLQCRTAGLDGAAPWRRSRAVANSDAHFWMNVTMVGDASVNHTYAFNVFDFSDNTHRAGAVITRAGFYSIAITDADGDLISNETIVRADVHPAAPLGSASTLAMPAIVPAFVPVTVRLRARDKYHNEVPLDQLCDDDASQLSCCEAHAEASESTTDEANVTVACGIVRQPNLDDASRRRERGAYLAVGLQVNSVGSLPAVAVRVRGASEMFEHVYRSPFRHVRAVAPSQFAKLSAVANPDVTFGQTIALFAPPPAEPASPPPPNPRSPPTPPPEGKMSALFTPPSTSERSNVPAESQKNMLMSPPQPPQLPPLGIAAQARTFTPATSKSREANSPLIVIAVSVSCAILVAALIVRRAWHSIRSWQITVTRAVEKMKAPKSPPPLRQDPVTGEWLTPPPSPPLTDDEEDEDKQNDAEKDRKVPKPPKRPRFHRPSAQPRPPSTLPPTWSRPAHPHLRTPSSPSPPSSPPSSPPLVSPPQSPPPSSAPLLPPLPYRPMPPPLPPPPPHSPPKRPQRLAPLPNPLASPPESQLSPRSVDLPLWRQEMRASAAPLTPTQPAKASSSSSTSSHRHALPSANVTRASVLASLSRDSRGRSPNRR